MRNSEAYMYKKGDYIVYGSNGPCLVADVTRLSMPGFDKKRKYYILRPVRSAKSTIYCPVDNEKVITRPILSQAQAEELLTEIPDIDHIHIESEKFREEQYKDIIRKSNVRDFVGIIKTLWRKQQQRIAQGRKFTSVDERYLREMEEILINEMAISLNQDRSVAERLVREKLRMPAMEKQG